MRSTKSSTRQERTHAHTHKHAHACTVTAACATLRLTFTPSALPSQKLKERKKTKGIKLDKKKKDDDIVISLGPLDRLRDAVVVPPRAVIGQRAFVYAFLIVWSLYQAAQSGPAFQMAVGFALTGYYVHDKRGGKNLWGALGQALLGLFVGWLAGSIIPVFLPLFPPSMSPETVASLFAFVSMWATATFFK